MTRSPFIYLVFFCLCLAAAPALAAPALTIGNEHGKEVIALAVPGAAKANLFTLPNPSRLVVDLPTLPKSLRIEMPKGYGGGVVTAVRVGKFNAKTSRIVFDLAEAPSSVRKRVRDGKLEIALSGNVTAVPAPAKPAPAALKQPKKKEQPPLVVIDAGHGGQDPGTIGRGGTREKSITLEYAHALRRALLATKRFRVSLTRDDDRFILLRSRVMIARKEKADLFVSLHADSAPDDAARGLSVYTLSEKASDAEAAALAERENKVDAVYGLNLSDQSKDVADILISLAQRDTNNHSATLAESLEHSLSAQGVKLLNNSHRFAGFAVLKSPDTPSVLVETGFLSNPSEEKQLTSKSYREKVAKGLARGIEVYFAGKRGGA